jgi:hypothetical protein
MSPRFIALFLVRALVLYIGLVVASIMTLNLSQPSITAYEVGAAIRTTHLREWLLIPTIILSLVLPSVSNLRAKSTETENAGQNRRPKTLKPAQLEKWATVRKDGKTHFAITRGIFAFGFPIILLWLIYRVCFDQVLVRENFYAFFGELVVIVPGVILFGYYFGRRQWDAREKQYLTARPEA